MAAAEAEADIDKPSSDATETDRADRLAARTNDAVFTEVGSDRTSLDLQRSKLQGYGDATEQMRAIFNSHDGWTGTLASFVDLANTEMQSEK